MELRRGALIHPEELDDIWLADMEQSGLSVLGLHPVGGAQADQSLREMIEDHFLPDRRALVEKALKMGISVEYEMHALKYLLPRRLCRSHPEYFRMDERGGRAPDFNFCPSSDGALEYIARRAELLARIFPSASGRYYFWLDDVTGYGCRCPSCKSLSPSDQQLLAVNAMLFGIRKADPAASIAYLAYFDAMNPPKKIRPDSGVFLEYAPIRRDSSVPIDDPSSEKNRAEARPIQALLDFFGTQGSQALEYWMDNSRFSNWKKPPKRFCLAEDVMKRDVAFYLKMGFESLTSFACYLGADYRALCGHPPVSRYGEILKG